MKKQITLFLCLISISLFSQKNDLQKEADVLLNQATVYSKIIKANEKTLSQTDRQNNFVFSFWDNKTIKSIVFSKMNDKKQIIQSITYSDSLTILKNDSVPRDKTIEENIIIKIYFNIYASSSYFPLPQDFWVIIEQESDKFYAYMFPQQIDLKNVIFGHDYLFTYKFDGEFKDFKFIHNNKILIPVENYGESKRTFHTHSNRNSNFISALDIANIIVCKNKLRWKKHFVVSNKYVSIFDLETLKLTIELKKDYEKRTGTILKI